MPALKQRFTSPVLDRVCAIGQRSDPADLTLHMFLHALADAMADDPGLRAELHLRAAQAGQLFMAADKAVGHVADPAVADELHRAAVRAGRRRP